jgi:hypothetical protein
VIICPSQTFIVGIHSRFALISTYSIFGFLAGIRLRNLDVANVFSPAAIVTHVCRWGLAGTKVWFVPVWVANIVILSAGAVICGTTRGTRLTVVARRRAHATITPPWGRGFCISQKCEVGESPYGKEL